MAELEQHYGDKKKMIDVCMKEVHRLPIISNDDFRGLIQVRDYLHMNFNILKTRKLEFEIVNSQTMKIIRVHVPKYQVLSALVYWDPLPQFPLLYGLQDKRVVKRAIAEEI